MDVSAYRQSAEAFLTDLTREYYLHYAGLKEAYEIEPIYERHEELFTARAIDSLCASSAPPPRREATRAARLRMLLDFAVEGHLGEQTKALETELAQPRGHADAGARRPADGLPRVLGRSGQRARRRGARRRSSGRATSLTETRARSAFIASCSSVSTRAPPRSGWSSYSEMCAECKSIDLAALHFQTAAFNADSDGRISRRCSNRRCAGRWGSSWTSYDARTSRGSSGRRRRTGSSRPIGSCRASWRRCSGSASMSPPRPRVHLDLDSRPNKSPRAFCAPVGVPGRGAPRAHARGRPRRLRRAVARGRPHRALRARRPADWPFEYRYLGDNAITEAYAFLFEHLVEDPEWLRRRLGIEDAGSLLAHGRAQRLIYVRRYAAKLAYELELHAAPHGRSWDDLAQRYAQLIGDALQIEWPSETFLADVDPGFYCACYLRAWALETHLRAYLRERFGPAWFDEREAGDVLRQLVGAGPAARGRGDARRAHRPAARVRRAAGRPRDG